MDSRRGHGQLVERRWLRRDIRRAENRGSMEMRDGDELWSGELWAQRVPTCCSGFCLTSVSARVGATVVRGCNGLSSVTRGRRKETKGVLLFADKRRRWEVNRERNGRASERKRERATLHRQVDRKDNRVDARGGF
ncbi:hypothetical protein TRVL_01827 [Trypanosoma vivax]|nr:hypothetical protein TRVL_01827 [Trypanosoma vivax]